jgi:hypothetical protein
MDYIFPRGQIFKVCIIFVIPAKDFLNKTIINILLRLFSIIPDDESIY